MIENLWRFFEPKYLGTIRNISPALWNLQHLTSLFIDNNFLEKLPPEISRLVNLQVLDVSDNQLHSLPVEMGDLRALQHLYLNNNYIRILPFELGKLSNLQTLELEGNPLNKEIAQIYRKPDATPMILQYLLRRLAVCSAKALFENGDGKES
ncbi:unnamed protein product [Soboliphyme baturini]|uniref:Leucine-rich repeat domain-containing protein n=1 Tax=Soboliphyme baturini TaxID=241478 RepID=A0A183ICI2_9BILA|nr:unnamed protein product [Soboliphyme baturini]